MRKAFIHAGDIKTGTTAFQAFIKSHREWLDGHGIYVPEAGVTPKGAHHRLARTICGLPLAGGQAVDLDEFRKEILDRDGQDVLISSETLQTLFRDPEMLNRFATIFKEMGYDVTVLTYLRDPFSLANSGYSQRCKSFNQAYSFADYITKGHVMKRVPHWYLLQESRKVEVVYKPFNGSVRKKGITRDILPMIGIDAEPPAFKRESNISPGPVFIGIARWFVRDMAVNGRLMNPRQRTGMRYALQKISPDIEIVDEAYCGLTETLIDVIRTDVEVELDRLARTVWGTPWEEHFPEAYAREFVCNDTDIVARARPSSADWRDILAYMRVNWSRIEKKSKMSVHAPNHTMSQALKSAGKELPGSHNDYWERFEKGS